MKVEQKFSLVKSNIVSACNRSARSPEEVTVIAVTKYVSEERALEALDAGIIHFGENRDEGLAAKWDRLGDRPVWHFIGNLQTRKVKNIIDKVTYIHSLDRHSLAKEINKRANRQIKCFVQINTSGEESKQGLKPDEAIKFINELKEYPHILVVGLMTMAPNTNEENILRNCFRRLKDLQTEVENLSLHHAPCKELSMGMSNDYMIAIEEGATFVRIGTALVGE
ncbi:YggS family pyridoxal phosphate-dependent enzyme [Lederbergia citrea]|uniref:Pyridoxal phosphate homeostasis protein n=1 Tax=Lederbergia citrea TaxID=2833581 RepID=A0A942UJ09_9BACI|nr:YggS family pyridoxal phosphate-dependent enzyme [Lederbergia citrea]MBS4177197.1 YggS family pyridoxal phosphate-dependent enzyme [Lederbergia citrea]MBS4203860.1 YggS family pyridoxal phosphate-dependent enzyme [Lederbergia citrea]MBS4221555.1 YggS family pyridoxal phosphate-dependent enzyme [Lederbergia citrea]